jgi:hypothetical protein
VSGEPRIPTLAYINRLMKMAAASGREADSSIARPRASLWSRCEGDREEGCRGNEIPAALSRGAAPRRRLVHQQRADREDRSGSAAGMRQRRRGWPRLDGEAGGSGWRTAFPGDGGGTVPTIGRNKTKAQVKELRLRPGLCHVVTSERVTGIEPALSAWEADVLPLNYTRMPGGWTSRRRRA